MRYFVYNLVLGLLLLAQLGEALPGMHLHEELHACAEIDDQFVYIARIDGACDDSSQGPSLRGFELGRRHHHQECSLCHKTTLALFDLPRYQFDAGLLPQKAACFHSRIADGAPFVLRSRGPPQPIA